MKALAASWFGISQMETGEAFTLCVIIAGMICTIAFLAIQFNLLIHQVL
jgi:hypothetical protein